ncbi:MAG: AAA family ATPase [Oceanospirillaceae bacterium]|nr:AAA family ATPase [Oceanospirillaceae bacterium]
MALPEYFVRAVYQDPGTDEYRDNPFIEALPPVLGIQQIKKGLQGKVSFSYQDVYTEGRLRAHLVAGLLDDFFQPISNHIQLEAKISIMIRQGYVGRSLSDGSLNYHMQNGYERLMSGDLESFRFKQTRSTARSLALIGCSGSGKTSTVNRILACYPQVVFHEERNFIQLTYLKIECPHNGSLKSLCINFFREVDRVLNTEYERQYSRKRHGEPTLLALMSQVATHRAIGILVIDEIQRLSRKHSGGQENMLEFFVELVNTVGVPVILVGTPKARPIFELELQSARRSVGFGSMFWEPMRELPDTQKSRNEWIAFTDKLWKYQWLKNRDEDISEEIRSCWFELSQGVLDIVVKLFVLAQLRAIASGVERLSASLLRQVYKDELKPVHPMLEALRSNDVELIAKYSDLHIPDIDKRLLDLKRSIIEEHLHQESELDKFGGNAQAKKMYNLLVGMGYQSELLVPIIEKIFREMPNLSMPQMNKVIIEWYEESGCHPIKIKAPKQVKIKQENWHTLASDDLRFVFSQSKDESIHKDLAEREALFDLHDWVQNF